MKWNRTQNLFRRDTLSLLLLFSARVLNMQSFWTRPECTAYIVRSTFTFSPIYLPIIWSTELRDLKFLNAEFVGMLGYVLLDFWSLFIVGFLKHRHVARLIVSSKTYLRNITQYRATAEVCFLLLFLLFHFSFISLRCVYNKWSVKKPTASNYR